MLNAINTTIVRVIWRVPQVKQKLCTFPEYPSVHSVSREVDVAQSFTDSDSFGIFKLFFHCRCCVLSIIVCLYALIPWSIVLYVPDRLLLYYMYLTVFYCIICTRPSSIVLYVPDRLLLYCMYPTVFYCIVCTWPSSIVLYVSDRLLLFGYIQYNRRWSGTYITIEDGRVHIIQ
jgi:hypothetical protein